MKLKPELVLDAAGVIVTNFSPRFWQELVWRYGLPYDKLAQFKQEIRVSLWTGVISEDEFWDEICSRFPAMDRDEARIRLLSQITPLPAADQIPRWSEHAHIHLLSNHRSEWLEPIVEPLRPYLRSITISSTAGCCKPNAPIYELVEQHFESRASVLFVDDQEKNFKEPELRGWTNVLADEQGDWVNRVNRFLAI
ncbi:HAD family hydrolase [Paenibacillus glycanilyticus]|uniref:HAD family hydrolase n=1 Tax=Paenibacillus glycanilyticus TaxID=126569 RepID=UPI003EBF172D